MYIIISIISHRPSNKGSPPWLLCSSSSFAVESDLWLVSTRTWRVEAASGKKFGPFNDSREIGTWKSVAPRHPSNSVRSHTLWRSSASWIAMISRMNCQVFKLRLSGIELWELALCSYKSKQSAEIQYLISSGSDTAQTKKKRSEKSDLFYSCTNWFNKKAFNHQNTALHSWLIKCTWLCRFSFSRFSQGTLLKLVSSPYLWAYQSLHRRFTRFECDAKHNCEAVKWGYH